MTDIILELTSAEAKFLQSVLISTVLWDSPQGHIAHKIYEALEEVGVTDGKYAFVYDTNTGYFTAEKAA